MKRSKAGCRKVPGHAIGEYACLCYVDSLKGMCSTRSSVVRAQFLASSVPSIAVAGGASVQHAWRESTQKSADQRHLHLVSSGWEVYEGHAEVSRTARPSQRVWKCMGEHAEGRSARTTSDSMAAGACCKHGRDSAHVWPYVIPRTATAFLLRGYPPRTTPSGSCTIFCLHAIRAQTLFATVTACAPAWWRLMSALQVAVQRIVVDGQLDEQ